MWLINSSDKDDRYNDMNTDDDSDSLELKYILIENTESSDDEEMAEEQTQQPSPHETSFNLVDLDESISREQTKKYDGES